MTTELTCEVCYEVDVRKTFKIYNCNCKVAICTNCFFNYTKNLLDSHNAVKRDWKCPQSDKDKMYRCSS